MAPVYGLAECALDLAFPPGRRGVLVDRIDRERLAADRRRGAGGGRRGARARASSRAAARSPATRCASSTQAGRELPERHVGRVEFQGPVGDERLLPQPRGHARRCSTTAGSTPATSATSPPASCTSPAVQGHDHPRAASNVYPYELEEAVGAIPGIRKGCVAVFGVGDPATGTERVVVLAETRETDAAKRERAAPRRSTRSPRS